MTKKMLLIRICVCLFFCGRTTGANPEICGQERFNGEKGQWSVFLNETTNLDFQCDWEVTVPPNMVIEASVTGTLDGIKCPICLCAYIQWGVFKGVLDIKFAEFQDCEGMKSKGNVLSSLTNTMKLRYVPTFYHGGNGFQLKFQAVTPEAAINQFKECGGTLTDAEGSLNSPGFPKKYPTGLKCIWHIIPRQGNRSFNFLVKYHIFDLECGRECRSTTPNVDYVGFYDDKGEKLHIQTRYPVRGSDTYTGRNLTIVFLSDLERVGNGFSIFYSTLPPDPPKRYFINSRNFTGKAGILTSSNYARNHYPEFAFTQRFTIIQHRNMELLTFTILDMDIEPNPKCLLDKLSVDIPGWKECGLVKEPLTFTTTFPDWRFVRLTFTTDSSIVRRGFRIEYKQSKCKYRLTGKKGKFSSPNYPNRYPKSLDCTWNIIVKPGLFAELRFKVFSIGNDIRNRVDIFVGKNNTLLGSFTHIKAPDVIRSHDNIITVKFTTESYVSSKTADGFLGEYKAVKKIKVIKPKKVVCGGVLTANEGRIISPGYPKSYPRNLNCSWIIEPTEPFTFFNITFEAFHLEESLTTYDCPADALWIFSFSRNFEYCGNMEVYGSGALPKSPFGITDKTLRLNLTTDDSLQRPGFSISYTTILQVCGGNFSDLEGEFRSPGYGTYEALNTSCVWTITVPTQSVVQLSILEFTSRHVQGFTCLEFLTGPNKIFLRRFCDSHNDKKKLGLITAPSNIMTVKYHSGGNDNDGETDGFRVKYKAVAPTDRMDCDQKLVADSGTLLSPGSPEKYPHDVRCYYSFTLSDPSVFIEITFLEFQLEEFYECTADFVQLFSGENQEEGKVKRMCDISVPHKVLIRGIRAKMLFVTDETISRKGFRATYRTIKVKSTINDIIEDILPAYKNVVKRVTGNKRFDEIQPALRAGIPITADHLKFISNNARNIRIPDFFHLILQTHKFTTINRGWTGEILFTEPIIADMDTILDKYNNIIEFFTELTDILVPESPANVNLKPVYNLLKSSFKLAVDLVKDVNQLWDKLPRLINDESTFPHRHIGDLQAATLALVLQLQHSLVYTSQQQEEINLKMCDIKSSGPACVMEKIEELQTLANFVQTLHQRGTDQMSAVLRDALQKTKDIDIVKKRLQLLNLS